MLQKLLDRFTGRVLFEAEIGADADTREGVRVGLAAKVAVKAGADLREANLRRADLREANLRRADLGGADLRRADLGGADLGEADLRRADLGGADLRGADLRGADLRGADLGEADLGGADLRGANLRDVRWGEGARWAEGASVTREPIFIAGLRYPVWILDRHAQVGCKVLAIDEWAAMDEARVEKLESHAAVTFWRQWRDALLAVAKAAGRPLPAATGEEG